jgi:hypothetical protein
MTEQDIIITARLSVDFSDREKKWWRTALSASVIEEESRRAFRLLIDALRQRQCHYLISALAYDRATKV